MGLLSHKRDYICQYCHKTYKSDGSVVNTQPDKVGRASSNYRFDSSKVCSLECKINLMKENIEKTNIKKFGCKNPFQNKQVKEKIKNTLTTKYNGHPFKTQSCLDKRKQTYLAKYGVESPMHLRYVRDACKQGLYHKYGVMHPGSSTEIRNKVEQTMLKRYGVEHVSQVNKLKRRNYEDWSDISRFKQCLIDNGLDSIMKIAKYFDVTHSSALHKINKCNCRNMISFHQFVSEGENELADYIASISLNIEIIRNIREIIPPYELDIYIPKLKLAFEYNGEYWHNRDKSKKNDMMKSDLCREQGITLIYVWESDWLDNQDRVKQRLQEIIRKKI